MGFWWHIHQWFVRNESAAWQYYLCSIHKERLVVGLAVIAQWLEHWHLKPATCVWFPATPYLLSALIISLNTFLLILLSKITINWVMTTNWVNLIVMIMLLASTEILSLHYSNITILWYHYSTLLTYNLAMHTWTRCTTKSKQGDLAARKEEVVSSVVSF